MVDSVLDTIKLTEIDTYSTVRTVWRVTVQRQLCSLSVLLWQYYLDVRTVYIAKQELVEKGS